LGGLHQIDSFHSIEMTAVAIKSTKLRSPSATAKPRCGCVGGGTSQAYRRVGVERRQWYVGVHRA